jgi:hypothetical protein
MHVKLNEGTCKKTKQEGKDVARRKISGGLYWFNGCKTVTFSKKKVTNRRSCWAAVATQQNTSAVLVLRESGIFIFRWNAIGSIDFFW